MLKSFLFKLKKMIDKVDNYKDDEYGFNMNLLPYSPAGKLPDIVTGTLSPDRVSNRLD